MDNPNFDYEFYSEVENIDDGAQADALERLERLAEGHNDMIGASVKVEKYAIGKEAFEFLVSIEAFIKPKYIRATEKAGEPEIALRQAVKAIEKQVREARNKRGKPWEQP